MTADAASIPPGRIDIHSHILPGIDDGCRSVDECVAAIGLLQREGFVGSVCTPHVWPELYPANTAENIAQWTQGLQQELQSRQIDYRLWPGGEVRLFPQVIEWMEAAEVPTLAGSRCVLVDLWSDRWPRWIHRAIDWLLEHDYQPVLAHPERINVKRKLESRLNELVDQGVWLQGNFRCVTGEDGSHADRVMRSLLADQRYTFLALDMHRPDDLPARIDGMDVVASEFGQNVVDRMTIENPRELILGGETGI